MTIKRVQSRKKAASYSFRTLKLSKKGKFSFEYITYSVSDVIRIVSLISSCIFSQTAYFASSFPDS